MPGFVQNWPAPRVNEACSPQSKVPDIVADPGHPTAWIEPDSKQPLTFHAVGQPQPLTLVPLSHVLHERYAVYWKVKNKSR
jgi:hypothetical protein